VDAIAEHIFSLNEGLEEPSAVVRADVVHGTYNMVIPIYAVDQDQIDEIVGMIKGVDGVTKAETLTIKGYHPFPPHDAPGYITKEETETSNPVAAGPLGMNAWG
jgi:hypothetical protein